MQSSSDPNKAKVTPEERARLRRNQRNSRARKQEYLHDLERRWAECVRLGVQASSEIQKEARRVHEENKALRYIVREMGMSDDTLRQRLESLMGAVGSLAATPQNSGEPACTTTCSPTVQAKPSATSNMGPTMALEPPDMFNQVIAPPTSTTAYSMQSTAPDLLGYHEDRITPDALQTWDLYSWVNDLSNIKDAYGMQSQFDYDGATSSSNGLYPASGVDETTGGPLVQMVTNGSPWTLHDSGMVNGNGPSSLAGVDNANLDLVQELEALHSRIPSSVSENSLPTAPLYFRDGSAFHS